MTLRNLKCAQFLPVLAATLVLSGLLSGGIFTIPAANARPAAAECPAPPVALKNFKPAETNSAPVAEAFQDAEGNPVTVAEAARKRGVVINFWATWCAPCIKEMPELDALKKTLAADGIDVIALSQDRGGLAKVAPFFKKQGYANLDIHLDPKSAFGRAYKIRGLPTTIIFDRDGRELGRLEGIAEWNATEVVDFIRACLPAQSGE